MLKSLMECTSIKLLYNFLKENKITSDGKYPFIFSSSEAYDFLMKEVKECPSELIEEIGLVEYAEMILESDETIYRSDYLYRSNDFEYVEIDLDNFESIKVTIALFLIENGVIVEIPSEVELKIILNGVDKETLSLLLNRFQDNREDKSSDVIILDLNNRQIITDDMDYECGIFSGLIKRIFIPKN